jgi:hypothetical protein
MHPEDVSDDWSRISMNDIERMHLVYGGYGGNGGEPFEISNLPVGEFTVVALVWGPFLGGGPGDFGWDDNTPLADIRHAVGQELVTLREGETTEVSITLR